MTAPFPLVLSLDDTNAEVAALAGHKAASLSRHRRAGRPVPAGFVIPPAERLTAEALRAARDAFSELGGPVAVRSSGVAEDLAGASFAGQYETVLDVADVEALEHAIEQCHASASAPRVAAYRAERGIDAAPLAILVQRMVPATAAGVAFTADPLTGERGVVRISAVPGLGESLVSGLADGEEWEVRGGGATCRRMRPEVLDPERAARVAALALDVAGGEPTDIEWAFDGDRLYLLQARPMTGVPEPVSWEITAKGAYVRHFRFGEWIGAPLTPLSESWLVTDLEEWCHRRVKQLWGMDPPRPLHVIVNGWYFYGGLNIDITNPWVWLRALPTLLWNLPRHFREIASTSAKPLGFRHEWKRWRNELLPPYRAEVERARARVGVAGPEESLDLVQALVDAAAAQFTSIIGVSGYGATIEFDLRVFLGKHAPAHRWRVHELIGRIGTPPAEHDVEGLDWVFPTAGERGPLPPGPSPEACAEIDARRARAESDIRAALPPKLVQKFEHLLREMRDGHTACQEQSPLATLAWPTMRALLLGVGERLAAAGVIRSAEDVFFLTRSELQAAVRGERVEADTGARRTTWERQRKLAPPLMLGEKTGIYKMVWDQVEAMNAHDDRLDPNVLGGCPSAPGQVTAVARVIRGLDELDRLQPGEILVAPVTTPAWTAAFGKAAGVVTDAGSFCSHASIVAREHGIPAVVATAHGTTRIRDGQRITLDGSTGIVRLST